VSRHRAEARQLLEGRGYLRPAVFGSVARGADRVDSDVDLLVDLPVDVGLYQLNRAAIDLEDLLGVPVDLVPRSGLRDRVSADVAADLVPL
jgi:predicted nucleotidyltransferase